MTPRECATCRHGTRVTDWDGVPWVLCWLRAMPPSKALAKKLPACECHAVLPPDALCGGWQRREDTPVEPQDVA